LSRDLYKTCTLGAYANKEKMRGLVRRLAREKAKWQDVIRRANIRADL
jgi:hypothetical protein